MESLPLAALIGLLAGFFGAIPPGPLNVNVLRKTLHNQRRDAFRAALGGAAVDALICGVIGLGFGWAIQAVVSNRWVRGVLALFLVAYGLKILFWDRAREEAAERLATGNHDGSGETLRLSGHASRFPVLTGVLQGAANPAVVVNWTLLISFLVSHRLLLPRLLPAGAFALGIGLGVFAWFALLIELFSAVSAPTVWVRHSTLVAGILLVLFGIYFTARSVQAILTS
ncbi:MAG: LysE family transporter [Thermoanaerobaculia bacterium]